MNTIIIFELNKDKKTVKSLDDLQTLNVSSIYNYFYIDKLMQFIGQNIQ